MVSKCLCFLVPSLFLQAIGLVLSDKLFHTLVTVAQQGALKKSIQEAGSPQMKPSSKNVK